MSGEGSRVQGAPPYHPRYQQRAGILAAAALAVITSVCGYFLGSYINSRKAVPNVARTAYELVTQNTPNSNEAFLKVQREFENQGLRLLTDDAYNNQLALERQAENKKVTEAYNAEKATLQTKINECQRQLTECQEAQEASKKPARHATGPYTPASPKHAKACEEYTVQKGDTLSEIGQRYGLSWQQLLDLEENAEFRQNPDLIYPGQKVCIAKESLQPSGAVPGRTSIPEAELRIATSEVTEITLDVNRALREATDRYLTADGAVSRSWEDKNFTTGELSDIVKKFQDAKQKAEREKQNLEEAKDALETYGAKGTKHYDALLANLATLEEMIRKADQALRAFQPVAEIVGEILTEQAPRAPTGEYAAAILRAPEGHDGIKLRVDKEGRIHGYVEQKVFREAKQRFGKGDLDLEIVVQHADGTNEGILVEHPSSGRAIPLKMTKPGDIVEFNLLYNKNRADGYGKTIFIPTKEQLLGAFPPVYADFLGSVQFGRNRKDMKTLEEHFTSQADLNFVAVHPEQATSAHLDFLKKREYFVRATDGQAVDIVDVIPLKGGDDAVSWEIIPVESNGQGVKHLKDGTLRLKLHYDREPNLAHNGVRVNYGFSNMRFIAVKDGEGNIIGAIPATVTDKKTWKQMVAEYGIPFALGIASEATFDFEGGVSRIIEEGIAPPPPHPGTE